MFFSISLSVFTFNSLRSLGEEFWNNFMIFTGIGDWYGSQIRSGSTDIYVDTALVLGIIILDIGAILVCLIAWRDIISGGFHRIPPFRNTARYPTPTRPDIDDQQPIRLVNQDFGMTPVSLSNLRQLTMETFLVPTHLNIDTSTETSSTPSTVSDGVVGFSSVHQAYQDISSSLDDEDDGDFDYLRCIHEPTEIYLTEYNQSLYDDVMKNVETAERKNVNLDDGESNDDDGGGDIGDGVVADDNGYDDDDDDDDDDDNDDDDDGHDYFRFIVEPSDEYIREYNRSMLQHEGNGNNTSLDSGDELEQPPHINWSEVPEEDADPASIPDWAVIPDWDFNRMG